MTEVRIRLARELTYNNWANRETLQSAQAASRLPDRAGAILAHIVAAEWLWLGRLGRPAPAIEVWPTLSLGDCERLLGELATAWRAYLTSLGPDFLTASIQYTNSKGEGWTNSVVDVLTHVVIHASHHRGQVATLLREAGETPAYVDYIECVRRGYLK